MTTTAKKTFRLPKKGKKPAPKPATENGALVPIPDDFHTLPTIRQNDALLALLLSIAAFQGSDPDRTVVRDFVVALSDDEVVSVWNWAREIEWGCEANSGDSHSVRESALQLPECLRDVVDHDLLSVENMLAKEVFIEAQIVRDLAPAPVSDSPTSTEVVVKAETPPAAKPDTNGQLPLVQEPAKAPKPITGLKLDSVDQIRSVQKSLDKRIAKLTDLAKKNRDEGKEAEAKSVEREVLMIREQLVPQLKTQGALAFNEGEAFPETVARFFAREFRSRVRSALTKTVTQKKGESHEDARKRQLVKLDDMEALIGHISEVGGMLVVNMLTNVSDRALEKGKMMHHATPTAIAREALQAMEIECAGRES